MKNFIKVLFLSFILMLMSACGVLDMLATVTGSEEISLGTGNVDDGILDERYEFSSDEDIMMELSLDEPFDTSEISFVIVKIDGNSEVIQTQWYESVDPSWDWLIYEFYIVSYDGMLETGDYLVRVYKNDSDLIGEKEFSIE
ncbi:hypothetical protein [Ornithinibacillus xuwenensis]|uniref:Uncharacterized protein n=1 Tax=Ornithinibacillus xuwenensis TaxID=3144668 RepID=A0ABU9XGX1_9BACI